MKSSKKILALAMSAAVVTSIAAAGTLAYLTSQDTAVNTFTVGKVDIEIDESKVGPDGKIIPGEAPVKQNEYVDVLPGDVLDKDPAVTVKGGSADCYVYVAVWNCLANASGQDVLEYVDWEANDENWEWVTEYLPWEAPAIEVYRYDGVLAEEGLVKSSNEDIQLGTVFVNNQVKIKGSATADDLADIYAPVILVKGFAIQADNLEADGMAGRDAADAMAEEFFTNLGNWSWE